MSQPPLPASNPNPNPASGRSDHQPAGGPPPQPPYGTAAAGPAATRPKKSGGGAAGIIVAVLGGFCCLAAIGLAILFVIFGTGFFTMISVSGIPKGDPSSGTGESAAPSGTSGPKNGTPGLDVWLDSARIEGEYDSVDTEKGVERPENGAFVAVNVKILNDTSASTPLSRKNFTVTAADGAVHPVAFGTTEGPSKTTEVPADGEATVTLFVDVPPGTRLTSVTYSDPAGTGGEDRTTKIT